MIEIRQIIDQMRHYETELHNAEAKALANGRCRFRGREQHGSIKR